ncbi:ArsR/SmtB family transcription factor [Pseudodesulfovibrio indicus]|uniref:ArsR family transcriptional regulator n=1 Tax=Pseudodesulfovibrio indicus TaxID=1716143 RepID=A0A126QJ77_9BACT|nr:metalloregulator ArsR/SmtB family transcription factor [Pseudodesulfovibrio indicus]AMK10030.1 ArsR family transcriptional regulator [Pseudodesulfovibrio indicus]TDT87002.1 ArsR family transcriptional regulator [Pseudodesulfovibrio indicus]
MEDILLADRFEERAKVVKAMAHPSRLMVIDELSRGERCVCDLRDLVGADLSTVSKHLSVLKRAGIVEDERRGKQIYYRLRVPCVINFFHCIESVIEAGRK